MNAPPGSLQCTLKSSVSGVHYSRTQVIATLLKTDGLYFVRNSKLTHHYFLENLCLRTIDVLNVTVLFSEILPFILFYVKEGNSSNLHEKKLRSLSLNSCPLEKLRLS